MHLATLWSWFLQSFACADTHCSFCRAESPPVVLGKLGNYLHSSTDLIKHSLNINHNAMHWGVLLRHNRIDQCPQSLATAKGVFPYLESLETCRCILGKAFSLFSARRVKLFVLSVLQLYFMIISLEHCGIMTSYFVIDIGQIWFKQ